MAVRLRRSKRIGVRQLLVRLSNAKKLLRAKVVAANVIRHSDWRIRSFAALKKSSEAFARQKVWKVFNKNVEKFVEKASPGTLTARTANA
jgi:hypothetical protein